MKEFSKFISAVKKGERTDQYVILAALFCAGGENNSVTVKQITQILKLHFGSDLPSNINASLRKYQGLVAPVEIGPPIKWMLTEEGIGRLEEISGLELHPKQIEVTSSNDSSNGAAYNTDIAIICALDFPEFAAVEAAFNEQPWTDVQEPSFTHLYRETQIKSETGETLRIIGTTSTSMGLTAAAIATTQLIMKFKPRIVVMVGIAAGTPSGGKQFGDVLTADPSVDYNSGKIIFENGVRKFQPDPYPIGLNPRLRSVLHRYRGNHPVFEKIRSRWSQPHPSKATRLHVGPLGAADQVIDDPNRITEIQTNWRKLIGIEMETYGVYRAVDEAPEPKPRAVSFKSICDFAAEKTDSWQEYAAFTAAEFAYEFLKKEWGNLWPKY